MAFYILGGNGCIDYCSGQISKIVDYISCNTDVRWVDRKTFYKEIWELCFNIQRANI